MLVALGIFVVGVLLIFIPWAWHRAGLDKDKQYKEQTRRYWDKFSTKDWRSGCCHIDMAAKPQAPGEQLEENKTKEKGEPSPGKENL